MASSPDAVPQAGEAPEEAVRILAHLTQHRQVRGCVTLTAEEGHVLWSGGSAFTTSNNQDGDEALAHVVQFVQELLTVSRRNISFIHEGVCGLVLTQDELGLLRVRTKKYELLVTPST